MMKANKLLNVVLMAGALSMSSKTIEGFNPSVTLTGQGGLSSNPLQDFLGQSIVYAPYTIGRKIIAFDFRGMFNCERDIEFNIGGVYAYRIDEDSAARGFIHFDVRHVDDVVLNDKALAWFKGFTLGAEYIGKKWAVNGNLFLSFSSGHPMLKGASNRAFRHQASTFTGEKTSDEYKQHIDRSIHSLVVTDHIRVELTGYDFFIDGLTVSGIALVNVNITGQDYHHLVAGIELGAHISYEIWQNVEGFVNLYWSPYGNGRDASKGWTDFSAGYPRIEFGITGKTNVLDETYTDRVTELLNKAPRRDIDIIVKKCSVDPTTHNPQGMHHDTDPMVP